MKKKKKFIGSIQSRARWRRVQEMLICMGVAAAVGCGSERQSKPTGAATGTMLYWNTHGSHTNHDLFRVNVDGTGYQAHTNEGLQGIAVDPAADRLYTNVFRNGFVSYSLSGFEKIESPNPALADADVNDVELGPLVNTTTQELVWIEVNTDDPYLFDTELKRLRLSDGTQPPPVSLLPAGFFNEDIFPNLTDLALDREHNRVYALFDFYDYDADTSHYFISGMDLNAETPTATLVYRADGPSGFLAGLEYSAHNDKLLVVSGTKILDENGYYVARIDKQIISLDPATGDTAVIHPKVDFTNFVVDIDTDRIYYFRDSGHDEFDGSLVEAKWSDLSIVQTVIDIENKIGDLVLVKKAPPPPTKRKRLYWNTHGSDTNHDLFRVNVDGTGYQTLDNRHLQGIAINPDADRLYTSLAFEGFVSYSLSNFEPIADPNPALANAEVNYIELGPLINTMTQELVWTEIDFDGPSPFDIELKRLQLSDGTQPPPVSLLPPGFLNDESLQTLTDFVVDRRNNKAYALFEIYIYSADASDYIISEVDMNAETPSAVLVHRVEGPVLSLAGLEYSADDDKLWVVRISEILDENGYFVGSEKQLMSVDPTTGDTAVIRPKVDFTNFVVDADADRVYYYRKSDRDGEDPRTTGSIIEAKWSDLSIIGTVIESISIVGDLVLSEETVTSKCTEETCDDNDPCTIDACTPTGCTHTRDRDACEPRVVANVEMWGAPFTKRAKRDGNYLYVLSRDTLKIFDVTDPLAPVAVGRANATDPRDLAILGDWAFLVGRFGLEVFDITDRSSPTLKTTLDLGFMSSVALRGARLFVVGWDSLQIVNVDEPATPYVEGKTELTPGASHIHVGPFQAYVAGGSGMLDIVSTVPYDNPRLVHSVEVGDWAGAIDGWGPNYVYVGNHRNGRVELAVVAVDTHNPAAAEVIRYVDLSRSTAGTSRPWGLMGLTVHGETLDESLALAQSWEQGDNLFLLDMSNPESPQVVHKTRRHGSGGIDIAIDGTTAFAAAGNSGIEIFDLSSGTEAKLVSRIGSAEARSLAYASPYLYLGSTSSRDDVSAGILGGMKVFDVSDPRAPTLTASHPASYGSMVDMTTNGQRLYVSENSGGLSVVDLTSDPLAAAPVSLPGSALNSVAIIDNDHVLALRWRDKLHTIDVSDPSVPAIAATYENRYTVFGQGAIVYRDSLAYVANYTLPFRVFDASDPLNVKPRGSVSLGRSPQSDVRVTGTTAWVGQFDGTVTIVDISDPDSLSAVGTLQFAASVRGIEFAGDRAIVVDNDGGVAIYDITDPRTPVEVTRLTLASAASDVIAGDGHAFVTLRDNTLVIIDGI